MVLVTTKCVLRIEIYVRTWNVIVHVYISVWVGLQGIEFNLGEMLYKCVLVGESWEEVHVYSVWPVTPSWMQAVKCTYVYKSPGVETVHSSTGVESLHPCKPKPPQCTP